jgi:hypothetical protein
MEFVQEGMSMEKKDSTMRTINLEQGGGGGLILLPAAPVAENLSKSSLGSCSDITIMQQQLHHRHQIRNNNNNNNNSTRSRMLASRALEELARTHPPQSASMCLFPVFFPHSLQFMWCALCRSPKPFWHRCNVSLSPLMMSTCSLSRLGHSIPDMVLYWQSEGSQLLFWVCVCLVTTPDPCLASISL